MSDNRSNRRDFLRGKAATRALAGLVPDAPPAESPAAAGQRSGGYAPEHYVLHVGRRAMACEFQVMFNAGQYPGATEVALEALDAIDRIEAELSFFRQSSTLARINREAAFRPVQVDAPLFDLLQTAVALSRETGGAYDITSTPYWELWGFSKRAGTIPADAELAEAAQLVGVELVELDPESRSVRFRRPGVRLNLGSLGKGFALDRCAADLAARGIVDFLLHGGNSSVLARGSSGAVAAGGGSGWSVGLKHPLRNDRRIGEVRLADRALGTSGSQAQSFFHRGKRLGHIIDPRTGRPAEGMFWTTVLAPTGLLADALSTAFYVMPVEETLAYCQRHPEVSALLMRATRRGGGFELVTANLGQEWSPASG